MPCTTQPCRQNSYYEHAVGRQAPQGGALQSVRGVFHHAAGIARHRLGTGPVALRSRDAKDQENLDFQFILPVSAISNLVQLSIENIFKH